MPVDRIGILVINVSFYFGKSFELNGMKLIEDNGEYAKSYCKQLYAI